MTTDNPKFSRVLQMLANNEMIAAHIVTTPDRCRDYPLVPISDYHAIVNVEPKVENITRWRYWPLQQNKRSHNLVGFDVVYREIDADKYEKFTQYARGAEEKDIFASRVEKHGARSAQELVDVLANYNVKLDDMRLGRMTD
ncbi:MAG: hypothetical protein ACRYFS_13900 [Janthinobacterium lividum]